MNDSEIKFELLENGLDFIKSAIEYILENPTKTDIKYALLHIFAGVELILKYRLSKEHWTLLFQTIDKAKIKKLNSGDFISVNYDTCISRLKDICSIYFIEKDLNELRILKEKRNKMEHYALIDSIEAIKSSFYKVLNFILNFFRDHIEEESLNENEKVILDKIRNYFKNLEDFISHRLSEISGNINLLSQEFTLTVCPKCFQNALILNDNKKCLFCNYTNDEETLSSEFIENILLVNEYRTIKHGGEFPLYHCLECGKKSFVNATSEDKINKWICFSCGLESEPNEISFCDTCGSPYYFNVDCCGMCKTCIDNRMGD